MKKYSIAARLPVNVIIFAKSKKEALKFARESTDLSYEPAGDIEFKDDANIVELEEGK
jgi:hypothetical protein